MRKVSLSILSIIIGLLIITHVCGYGTGDLEGRNIVAAGDVSIGATPASEGSIRLKNNGSMKYRNATNNGDFDFLAWSSGVLDIGGVSSSTINITNNSTDALNLVTGPVVASSSVQAAGIISSSTGSTTAAAYSFSTDANTGVNRPGADTVGILTGGAITAKFGTDSATFTGNVGIGCTPNALLSLSSGIGTKLLLYDGGTIAQGGNGYFAGFAMDKPSGGGTMMLTSHTGYLSFGRYTNSNDTANVTEWARITNDGLFGINCTPSNGKLEIQTSATSPALWVQTGGTTSSYTIADFRTGTNGSALALYGNGNAAFSYNVGIGTSAPTHALHMGTDDAFKATEHWTTTSDERLKEDITTIGGALDKVKALRGVSWKWKPSSGMGDGGKRHTGLVAQEVEKIIPEWVVTDSNGVKGIRMTGDTALLVEAIKEQQKMIEALTKRIEALEAK